MTTLAGVVKTEIGVRYDVAIGIDLGATTTMVGYVLAPGTTWTEATDIQDNERIVQIASPNSTDRFTFYPKVSQGTWSGGERQITFVDPTRYYQSQKLETSLDGHLFIYGLYLRSTLTVGTGVTSLTRNMTFNGAGGTYAAYICCLAGGTANLIGVTDNGTSAPGMTRLTMSNLDNKVSEIIKTPSLPYCNVSGGTNPGIYEIIAGGGPNRVGTDQPSGGANLAYFNNAIWYFTNANPGVLTSLTNPETGGGAGVAQYTSLDVENPDGANYLGALGSTPTGLMFAITGASGTYQPGAVSAVYTFDGTAATLIGQVPFIIIDILTAGGVTFLLGNAQITTGGSQPVLLAYYGGQLITFDDYRFLPSDFQTATGPAGNLATDGIFLYVAIEGLNTKRYDLRVFPSVAVSDIGDPRIVTDGDGVQTVAVSGGGIIAETNFVTGATAKLSWTVKQKGLASSGDTGYLITSYFDMGAPNTSKAYRSVEVELNAAMVGNASVAIAYNLDNQTSFANSLTMVTLGTNNLIGFFPAGTKAYRVQLKITLTANSAAGTKTSPDIRSYSINGRLGRVWKFTVQCRRQITDQSGALDQQGQRSQDLLANILNVYQKSAGNAILFVPDATSSTGVSQVNAVLEDYNLKTPKPGPSLSEQASADLEADCELTFVERL